MPEGIQDKNVEVYLSCITSFLLTLLIPSFPALNKFPDRSRGYLTKLRKLPGKGAPVSLKGSVVVGLCREREAAFGIGSLTSVWSMGSWRI